MAESRKLDDLLQLELVLVGAKKESSDLKVKEQIDAILKVIHEVNAQKIYLIIMQAIVKGETIPRNLQKRADLMGNNIGKALLAQNETLKNLQKTIAKLPLLNESAQATEANAKLLNKTIEVLSKNTAALFSENSRLSNAIKQQQQAARRGTPAKPTGVEHADRHSNRKLGKV
jgi:hypothetical protein